jgi:putative FmdB family regulatory protein
MPLYEYECLNCGKRTEVLQRFDDPPIAACPSCGGEVKKLISSPAFQFKGTGWYVTDYAGKKGPTDSKSKSEGKSEGGGDKAEKAEKPDKAEKGEKAEKPAAAAESKSSAGSGGGTE